MVMTAAPTFAGVGISIIRADRSCTTTSVAGWGDVVVRWVGQAKVSPVATLCAVVLVAPLPGASAPSISRTSGEGPRRLIRLKRIYNF
jgi:hypothetical protein